MITFVILQYNLSEKTIKSVQSIQKHTKIDYKIVIVDNSSTNDAYEIVKETFRDQPNIFVIKTNENLGFANGNNFGIQYASKKFDASYVVVINNDIYLKSQLDDSIVDEWNQLNFDVMGPDIFRLDTNEHQNPLPTVNYNLKWLYSFYWIYNIYRVLNVLHVDAILHKIAIATLDLRNKKSNKNIQIEKTQTVSKLHGSALVFSKAFLTKFPKPFNEATFMYLEEDFLALRCKRSKAKVIYFPDVIVHHDHGSTVTKITNNDHLKRKYIFKNNSHSFKQLIKYYKSDQV